MDYISEYQSCSVTSKFYNRRTVNFQGLRGHDTYETGVSVSIDNALMVTVSVIVGDGG